MDSQITRAEYLEYCKRMEDEHLRIKERVGHLETATEQISALANSVDRLATTMEFMVSEQKEQGKKLEKLEGRDGEKWRKVAGYVATAIAGIIIGFIFKQIGM